MSDAEDAFTQASDNLVALYRSLERKTLDLPLFSLVPILAFFWVVFKFYFFLLVGIFLLIPTNLVIFIRNLFPGHWRYRPFFLFHLYYVGLWLWRGEAPSAPLIFVRPVLGIFLKEHFASRLRRLRQEIVLHDGLADATRSDLMRRLDSALARWPRGFGTLRLTVLWTTIISLPVWSKKLADFLAWLGIDMDIVTTFFSEHISTGALLFFGLSTFGYVVAIPVTAFLAKRGLFVGADRIWFPGWQEGAGAYLKEREILGSVGIHVRETAIDLWVLGISYLLTTIIGLTTVVQLGTWVDSWTPQPQQPVHVDISVYRIEYISIAILLGLGIFIAALRRSKTGRA